MHMTSHSFVCDVAREAKMESYEHANGMRPVWVDLREALAHNRDVMLRQDSKMGLSIQRETFVLETGEQELF